MCSRMLFTMEFINSCSMDLPWFLVSSHLKSSNDEIVRLLEISQATSWPPHHTLGLPSNKSFIKPTDASGKCASVAGFFYNDSTNIFRFLEERWWRFWTQHTTRGRIFLQRSTSTKFPTPGINKKTEVNLKCKMFIGWRSLLLLSSRSCPRSRWM